MEKFELDLVGKAGRDAVDIEFLGLPPFRFEEKLVSSLVRKFHDLVLDGWTIARAGSLNPTAVERRSRQVAANDLMRVFARRRQPTRKLFHVETTVVPIERKKLLLSECLLDRQVAKPVRWFVSELFDASAEIDRTAVDPTRCARFEPPYPQSQLPQIVA
jgi:hypothetical protein